MSGRMGQRLGTILYPPDGIPLGSEPYVITGPDGALEIGWLAYPAGAALGDYVKVTGAAGLPVWLAKTLLFDPTAPGTFAWMWLYGIDATGATVLVLSEDGSPISIYMPVT